jgi:hypothetical protein
MEPTQMKMHHFVTKWFFHAPIDQVWEQITDVHSYPAIWSTWKTVSYRGSESELQLGSIIDYAARGPVPYTARFTFQITALQPPTLMEYQTSGDLVGEGSWILETHADGTSVTSQWDVGTSLRAFDFLTRLPFAGPFVRLHHDYVMDQGYRGFRAVLE